MSALQTHADTRQNQPAIFWGEISPCEHLVEIYEHEPVFLDSLQGFLAGGITAGDGVIVIATPDHLSALDERLEKEGFNLQASRSQHQYIALDAEETLSKFMVDGWPDDDLFEQVITQLLARARGSGRRVRAFGEMVALLWGRGYNRATVRLETLWHSICQREAFSLFCAYPRIGFAQDSESSMKDICALHSKVLSDANG